MKYFFAMLLGVAFFTSCHIKTKKIVDYSASKTPFSIDSLHGINYFDYYGKPLEEMLQNNIINQYFSGGTYGVEANQLRELHLDYFPDTLSWKGGRTLIITFGRIQELRVGRAVDYPAVEDFLKEKIVKIEFEQRNSVVKGMEGEIHFLEEFDKINFSDYYGKTVDGLLQLPILKRWSDIDFRGGEIAFFYVLKKKMVMLILTLDDGDLRENGYEYENLNYVRKRTIKEIRIR